MQVVALSCPNCGSALPRERARCEYCGTVTIISSDQSRAISIGVACPKCNATNNENEKHCGQCGAVLLIECPQAGCLQENSIWRKHCKKCGADILASWRAEIADRIAEIQDKLTHNRAELKQVAADLESAKSREMITKIIIGGGGGFISLLFFCSASAGGISLGLIVLAIALIWAANHKSEEKLMLLESASHCLTEIEELEAELKSLDGNKN